MPSPDDFVPDLTGGSPIVVKSWSVTLNRDDFPGRLHWMHEFDGAWWRGLACPGTWEPEAAGPETITDPTEARAGTVCGECKYQ